MGKSKQNACMCRRQESYMKKNIKTYLTHIQELKTKVQQLINENEGLIKKNKQLESTYILPYIDEELHFLLNQC
jgi:hypothetical protein